MRIPIQTVGVIRDGAAQMLNTGAAPSQLFEEFTRIGSAGWWRGCIPNCVCVSPLNCPCCADFNDIFGTGPTVGDVYP